MTLRRPGSGRSQARCKRCRPGFLDEDILKLCAVAGTASPTWLWVTALQLTCWHLRNSTPYSTTHFPTLALPAGTQSKSYRSRLGAVRHRKAISLTTYAFRYFYGAWRPITAIRYPGIYLASGRNFSDPIWKPLLDPTPNHQDYLSTHATFGGAAGAVIRAWNGGDEIDVQLSSNVTEIKQVITRRITNVTQAVVENGDSRIFGGIHFQYASDVGREIGGQVGRDTWDAFDEHWDEF